jgi:hypothetical protein
VQVIAPESARLVIETDLANAPGLRERVGQRVARQGATHDEDVRDRVRFVSSHELKRIEQARKRRARSTNRNGAA